MFRQSFYLLIDKVLKLWVTLGVSILVAREYDVETFGLFSLVLAVNGIFSGLQTLGLENILLKHRLLSKHWKHTYSLGVFVRLFFSTLLTAIIYSAQFLFTSYEEPIFWLFLLSVSNSLLSIDCFIQKYRAEENNLIVTLLNACIYTIGGIVKFYLIYKHYDLVNIFLVMIVESLVFGGALYFLNIRSIRWFRLEQQRYFRKSLMPLLSLSFPLILSSFISVLYMRIDVLCLSFFSGVESVAIYSAASRLVEIGYILIGIFSVAYFPRIINQFRTEETKAFVSAFRVAWISGGILCLTLIVLIAPISPYIYGDGYELTPNLVVILALACPFVSIRNFSGKIFIIKGFNKHLFYRSMTGLLFNVFFNILLIPLINVYGAAISTLISVIVVSIFYDMFFKMTLVLKCIMVALAS